MNPQPYIPHTTFKPLHLIDVPSAWRGLESIMLDILNRFGVPREAALEFGVDWGYSTVALSNFFKQVIGVDHFQGDVHAGSRDNSFEQKVRTALLPYPNISLITSSVDDFIRDNNNRYNLIHIDIVHNYEPTYQCGLWAANHADIVLFHDTESFPDVKRAVGDIAKATNLRFYNYPFCNGLGILSVKQL
jgi:hypothetical protein